MVLPLVFGDFDSIGGNVDPYLSRRNEDKSKF